MCVHNISLEECIKLQGTGCLQGEALGRGRGT